MKVKARPFQIPRALYAGNDALSYLPIEAQKQQAKQIVIITDSGLTKTGIIAEITGMLKAPGTEIIVFDKTEAEPSITNLLEAVNIVKESGAQLVIGIGGGSSMDTAKASAVLSCNSGQPEEYFGTNLIPLPGLPLILIPTTAGTGAEVTKNAIFTDEKARLKKGMVSEHLLPAAAIVDPRLTLSLPPAITAATGMDALTHAIEAYTSLKATLQTDLYALKAIGLIGRSLRRACAFGGDLDARFEMSMGSLFAGIAIANAGVGGVHALAYPLGGQYKVPHGISNALLLPHVMEFNIAGDPEKFSRVARELEVKEQAISNQELAFQGLEAVKKLSQEVNIPQTLREVGVEEGALEGMAQAAIQITRLMDNNPHKMTLLDARQIYEKAF